MAAAEAAAKELIRKKQELASQINGARIALLARKEYAALIKMKERRAFIAKEIVATEKTFVDGLLVMLELFQAPVRELVFFVLY